MRAFPVALPSQLSGRALPLIAGAKFSGSRARDEASGADKPMPVIAVVECDSVQVRIGQGTQDRWQVLMEGDLRWLTRLREAEEDA